MFGGLFDFNQDGKTDFFEMALSFFALSAAEEEGGEKEDSCGDILAYGDADDLICAGLDPTELSLMDEVERTETLEEAGLDPYDFVFM